MISKCMNFLSKFKSKFPIIIKILVRTKLKFYSFYGNRTLFLDSSQFTQNLKRPHKFSSLNVLMVNVTILKCHFVGKILAKTSLKFQRFGVRRGLELISTFGPFGPKLEKKIQNKIVRSSRSVKWIFGFLLPKRSRL